jgi:hypothetical protein
VTGKIEKDGSLWQRNCEYKITLKLSDLGRTYRNLCDLLEVYSSPHIFQRLFDDSLYLKGNTHMQSIQEFSCLMSEKVDILPGCSWCMHFCPWIKKRILFVSVELSNS